VSFGHLHHPVSYRLLELQLLLRRESSDLQAQREVSVNVLLLLVACETVVLALLTVVVIGLLRSYAEILRRLPEEPKEDLNSAASTPARTVSGSADRIVVPEHLPAPRAEQSPVVDIAGHTLDGAQVVLSPARTNTLIAFLSSGCLTCQTFWDGLQDGRREPLPFDTRLVVVVKGAEMESPARLRDLAPRDIPVVMSSEAWSDYGVQMSPYFLFVSEATGTVRSEGAASSWDQVRSLLRDAIEDERLLGEAARGAV
jgi:hypothetical protein